MPRFPPMPIDIMTLKVHITNAETDRNVSIRAAYLLVKSKPGFALHEQLFSAPSDPVSYTPLDRAFEFQANLAPQASQGGELVFELRSYQMADAVQPFEARVEIHDSISEKMASFPADLGTFRRHHRLRPATYAERVTRPKAAQSGYRVIGSSDRFLDVLTWPWRFPMN